MKQYFSFVLAFVLLFPSFIIPSFADESLEQKCYEVLMQNYEAEERAGNVLSKEQIEKDIQDISQFATYDAFVKNAHKTFEHHDLLLKGAFGTNPLQITDVQFGDSSQYTGKEVVPAHQSFKESEDTIKRHRLRFVHLPDSLGAGFAYCRRRNMEPVSIEFSKLGADNISMQLIEEPFEIEQVQYKGVNFKKVHLNKRIVGTDGKIVMYRKEWYAIPENSAVKNIYDPYVLIDDHKKAVDDYFSIFEPAVRAIPDSGWEVMNQFIPPEKAGFNKNQLKLAYKDVMGIHPVMLNNDIANVTDQRWIQYYLMKSMMMHNQSALQDFITLSPKQISDDALLEMYASYTKVSNVPFTETTALTSFTSELPWMYLVTDAIAETRGEQVAMPMKDFVQKLLALPKDEKGGVILNPESMGVITGSMNDVFTKFKPRETQPLDEFEKVTGDKRENMIRSTMQDSSKMYAVLGIFGGLTLLVILVRSRSRKEKKKK